MKDEGIMGCTYLGFFYFDFGFLVSTMIAQKRMERKKENQNTDTVLAEFHGIDLKRQVVCLF